MEKYLVTQSNELVEANHVDQLSIIEQKVILTIISMIEPSDDDLTVYKLNVKDFAELIGLSGKSAYSEMKRMATTLVSKVIEIPIKKNSYLVTSWVSSVKYDGQEGIVEFSFDSNLKPYLIQIKNQFSSYKLSNILNLNSSYSIRFYDLLRKWHSAGHWECSIDELKGYIGVVNIKSYNSYGNFKQKVLTPSLKEVNDKTDIKITIEEIKQGRKVSRIKFKIKYIPKKEIKLSAIDMPLEKEEKNYNDKENSEKNSELRKRLNELADKSVYQLNKKFFNELYEAAYFIWTDRVEEELTMLIKYVNAESSIRNPLGFIKSAIKSAWEDFEIGEKVTFTELKPSIQRPKGHTEVIPSWFKKNDDVEEPEEVISKKEIEERREALRRDLLEMHKRNS